MEWTIVSRKAMVISRQESLRDRLIVKNRLQKYKKSEFLSPRRGDILVTPYKRSAVCTAPQKLDVKLYL